MNVLINRAPKKINYWFNFLFLNLLTTVSFIGAESVEKKVVKLPTSHQVSVDFKSAVEKYIRTTKRYAFDPLKKNNEIEQPFFRELFYLFGRLEETLTIRQSVALIFRARTEHHKMMQSGIDVCSETFAHAERMYGAILLKCSSALTNNARAQLLAILEEVDNSLSYWEYQDKHYIKYFFSKSPFKWITGKSQAHEISDNIKTLGKLKYSIRVILGKLTTHLHNVKNVDDVDSCYTWIEELLSMLSCIKIKEELTVDNNRFAQIAEQLQHKISRVLYLKKDILSKSNIIFTQKSSHLVRYWVPYALAAAGVVYMGNYYYYNADEVNRNLLGRVPTKKDINDSSIVTNVKGIWNTIIGKSGKPMQDEKGNIIVDEHGKPILFESGSIIKERAVRVEELAKQFDAKIAEQLKKSNTSLLEDTFVLAEKVIATSHDRGFLSGIEKSSMDDALTNLRTCKSVLPDELNEYKELNIFLEKLDELGNKIHLVNFSIFPSTIAPYDLKWDIFKTYTKLVSIQEFFEPLQQYTTIIDKTALPLLKETTLMLSEAGDVIGDVIKENRLLSRFIPLFCTGWLGYKGITKGYEWLTARDYVAIRTALAEVNAIFIESPLPLDDHDYGKLVYLLHKLKNKALYLLPTKDNVCKSFLKDLAKLESQDFTAETKRLIISNMYNKYPFLVPNAKMA